jgi:hypothetical protein
MKKIFFLLSIIVLLSSCNNQPVDFDDFEYQGVYFPYQTPIRTLMLGDEVIGDNTIDQERAFSIGVSVGGMYKNEMDRDVAVELAPDLAENIINDDSGDTLSILPADYYNATFDRITIPEGSFFGKMRVELTDKFFEDPATIGLKYVIPVLITDAFGDTILSGSAKTDVETLDRRNKDHWNETPKDYTLFGIKYINPYHGVYLLRGQSINTTAVPQDTVVYSKRFLINNSNTKLTTLSMDECKMSVLGGVNQNGKYQMRLTFDENDQSLTISQLDATTAIVSGTGEYYTKNDEKSESYSEVKHRTIYMDYTFEDGGDTYHAYDSLVFIDTDVRFQTYKLRLFE